MTKDKKIHLPDLPQDEYYEDLVAALLCAGGYYIEKRMAMLVQTTDFYAKILAYVLRKC